MGVLHKRFVSFVGPMVQLCHKWEITEALLERAYSFYKYHLEDSFLPLLPRFIEQGDIVIDVGANIGLYSAIFSEHVGEGGRVLAIEPFVKHWEKVERMQLKNVVLFKGVASDKTAEETLFINPRHPGDHRSYETVDNKGFEKSVVPSASLSHLIEEYFLGKIVKLIKIDVQGRELAVLEGLRQYLDGQRKRPIIILEFSPREIRQCSGEGAVKKLEGFILEYGYRVDLLRKKKLIEIESLEVLEKRIGRDGYCDILLRPRENQC
jgi:FkbM family methyltransferase